MTQRPTRLLLPARTCFCEQPLPKPDRYLGQKPGHCIQWPRGDPGRVAQQTVDPAGAGVALNIGPGARGQDIEQSASWPARKVPEQALHQVRVSSGPWSLSDSSPVYQDNHPLKYAPAVSRPGPVCPPSHTLCRARPGTMTVQFGGEAGGFCAIKKSTSKGKGAGGQKESERYLQCSEPAISWLSWGRSRRQSLCTREPKL